MRIAICDDRVEDLRRLLMLLRDYFSEGNPKIPEIEYFLRGEDLLAAYERKKQYDILFLDMHLPGLNGMEVARRIRMRDRDCYIIFVTVTPEYAPEGYHVNAFRYLVKPFSEQDFQDALNRILSSQDGLFLFFEFEGAQYRVPASKIKYIIKEGKKAVIHMDNGSVLLSNLLLRDILSDLGDMLCFFMPYQTYIVNLKYIELIDKENKRIVLHDGQELPLSRDRVNEMKRVFKKYVSGIAYA